MIKEPNEINVCCPYFCVIPCGDTKEHAHLGCDAKGGLITNSETMFKCISDYNWVNCEIYKEKPIKY